jgi:hypothetical protein
MINPKQQINLYILFFAFYIFFFLQKIFIKKILVAILFINKIEVINIQFGKIAKTNIIKKILNFERPDAYSYKLVYGN